jgi:hypothetical protein
MSQDTLLMIMAAAVGVSALALLMQALLMVGVYRSAKVMQEQVAVLLPKAQSTLASAEQTLEQSRRQIAEVTSKATEVIDMTRSQVARVEGILADAGNRAKVQMDRVEMVLDDTLGRVQDTVAVLHSGIMRPLRQVNGVAVAVRAAFEHLLRGGRPSVAQATHDDEMFI